MSDERYSCGEPVYPVMPDGPAVVFVNSPGPTATVYHLDHPAQFPSSMSKRDRAIARALLLLSLESLDAADSPLAGLTAAPSFPQ